MAIRLPTNPEAEAAVLSAMCLSPDAAGDALVMLRREDFSTEAHRVMWDAAQSLYASGAPVEVMTVLEELRRAKTLETAGGPLAVRDVLEAALTPSSATHYARIVADAAVLRRLVVAAQEIINEAQQAPREVAQFADEAEGRIFAATSRADQESIAEIAESITQTLNDFEIAQARGSRYAGLASGFSDLDGKIGGLMPGSLLVLAARPGQGKSAFAANIARNVAKDEGLRVLFISLEMSHRELTSRLLCAEAQVPTNRARDGSLTAEEWERVALGSEQLATMPLVIVDSGRTTILDVRAHARRARARGGLGLIIVDYLQLMSPHRAVDSRQQEVAEITRGLKLLAKELQVPVLAVAQLNRQLESRANKRPQLSDLRESGAIEQDADVVMFLHQDADDQSQYDLNVAKNRHGPVATIGLQFEPRYTLFRSAALTRAKEVAK